MTTASTRRNPAALHCLPGHGRPGPRSTCTETRVTGPSTIRRRPPPPPSEIAADLADSGVARRVDAGGRHRGRVRRQGDHARTFRCRTTYRTPPGASSPIATRAFSPCTGSTATQSVHADRPGTRADRRAVDLGRERLYRDHRCRVQPGDTARRRRRAADPRRIGHVRDALTDAWAATGPPRRSLHEDTPLPSRRAMALWSRP